MSVEAKTITQDDGPDMVDNVKNVPLLYLHSRLHSYRKRGLPFMWAKLRRLSLRWLKQETPRVLHG